MDISATRGGSSAGRATRQGSSPRRRFVTLALSAALAALFVAGCGGGQAQNSDAPTGTWTVKVLRWDFPKTQPLGRPVDFILDVQNQDQRDIPQLIVTVSGAKTSLNSPAQPRSRARSGSPMTSITRTSRHTTRRPRRVSISARSLPVARSSTNFRSHRCAAATTASATHSRAICSAARSSSRQRISPRRRHA